MSHGIITESLAPHTNVYWKVEMKNACGEVSTIPYNTLSVIGDFMAKRLSATVNNPKNATGWRNPSPYSGFEKHGFINELKATATSKTKGYCPATKSYSFPTTRTWGLSSSAGTVVFSTTPYAMLDMTSAAAAAKQSALQKFRSGTIDLSVAFAERKKTAVIVTDTVDTIRSLYKDLVKWNSAKKVAKNIADLWLQYRYAWTPTLLDAYGAVEAIERLDNGTYDRYMFSTHASRGASAELNNEYPSVAGYCPVMVRTRTKRDATVKVRMDALLSDAAYISLQNVGVTDPAITAWELKHYTFIVDWFLGIQDFLEGANALNGYTWLGGSQTLFQRTAITVQYSSHENTQYRTDSVTGNAAVYEKQFSRTVIGPPTSQILLKSNPLNFTRLIDSIALLSGTMKRA